MKDIRKPVYQEDVEQRMRISTIIPGVLFIRFRRISANADRLNLRINPSQSV
jgi:hypothetical protein